MRSHDKDGARVGKNWWSFWLAGVFTFAATSVILLAVYCACLCGTFKVACMRLDYVHWVWNGNSYNY